MQVGYESGEVGSGMGNCEGGFAKHLCDVICRLEKGGLGYRKWPLFPFGVLKSEKSFL